MRRNILSEEAKQFSSNLGYVMGVLLGDGYFDRYGYRVMLECIDEEFARGFAKNMSEWCGFKICWREFIKCYKNRPQSSHCKKEYKIKMYKTGICSKDAYYFLKELMKDWYSCIKNADREIKLSLIRGFYDSEGSFSIIKRKRGDIKTDLRMSNMNNELLESIGNLVKDCLDIKLDLRMYPYESHLGTQDKKKAQIFLKSIVENH